MATESASFHAKMFRIFLIIAVLTLAQILWALVVSEHFSTSLNGFVYFLLLSVKVYYLLGEFMHIKHEARLFNVSLFALPAGFLIWFIISFCYEGNAGLKMQQKYNTRRPDVMAPMNHHYSSADEVK